MSDSEKIVNSVRDYCGYLEQLFESNIVSIVETLRRLSSLFAYALELEVVELEVEAEVPTLSDMDIKQVCECLTRLPFGYYHAQVAPAEMKNQDLLV